MDNIKQLIERFNREHGRYPSSYDFDKTEYLPNAKYIQRNYGGIIKLKKDLGLSFEEHDLRRGLKRSEKARIAMNKSNVDEDELYKLFIRKFGERNVHRESPYTNSGKIRSDFIIYYHPKNDERVAIDIFYPENIPSLIGCINHKLNKMDFSKLKYEVLLVNLNESLDYILNEKMENKKIRLSSNVKVVGKKMLIKILAQKYHNARL